MDASILILTFNAEGFIEECLSKIFRQKTDSAFEVIVIDSGSSDKTLEVVKRFPVRLIEIRREEFNHGLTRNRGVKFSKGDFVVLLTQDAIPADDYWLQNLLRNFEDDSVAGVYSRQFPRWDADPLTKRRLNDWLTGRGEKDIKFIDKNYNGLSPVERYFFVNFDNVSSCIRKSVWGDILFPETCFAEDLEWSKKVIEAGYKIVYEPESKVIHSHSRSPLYEFRRTFICHKKLYGLFKLQTIQKMEYAIGNFFHGTLRDWEYITHLKDISKSSKLSLLLKIPFFSAANVFGQYFGARNAKNKGESWIDRLIAGGI